MQDVDVGTIVPSTRDLLQVLGTRRRNLALLGLISGETSVPAEEAARLADLNVSAFAFAAPGPALAHAARATKTVPSLCLAAAADREALLSARQHGADGVVLDARLPPATWDQLARIARSMRMLPVALAVDAASVEIAVKAGARAILVQAGTADEVLTLAAGAPRTVVLVGHVEGGADLATASSALRALAGKVDAAVVPTSVHAAPGFADLVAEVDP
jgi:hypothetical protein